MLSKAILSVGLLLPAIPAAAFDFASFRYAISVFGEKVSKSFGAKGKSQVLSKAKLQDQIDAHLKFQELAKDLRIQQDEYRSFVNKLDGIAKSDQERLTVMYLKSSAQTTENLLEKYLRKKNPKPKEVTAAIQTILQNPKGKELNWFKTDVGIYAKTKEYFWSQADTLAIYYGARNGIDTLALGLYRGPEAVTSMIYAKIQHAESHMKISNSLQYLEAIQLLGLEKSELQDAYQFLRNTVRDTAKSLVGTHLSLEMRASIEYSVVTLARNESLMTTDGTATAILNLMETLGDSEIMHAADFVLSDSLNRAIEKQIALKF